ncbi:hypothetical protein [Reinekea sp.]|jgi:hypothetical protein|uniref:hypothetical protein n=1 Tax=Reinekea sp. TaxID=1970455 RepID=UPI003989F67F
MKRNFIQTAAIAIALTTVSLPSQAFSLFGWLSSDKNTVEDMIEFIPASTPIFFGSVSTKDMVKSSDEMMKSVDMGEVGEELASMISELSDGPTAEFVETLITDYYASASEGGVALYEAYGLDVDGASVFYMNGLYPVVRMAVEDEAAFLTILKQAAADSNFELTEKAINDDIITRIELTEFDGTTLSLGFLAKDGVLTISGFSNLDTDGYIAERFALTKPALALTAKDWKNDGKTYGFDETLRGYFSLIKLAETIFDPSSLAHSQFLLLTDSNERISNVVSDQCRSEALALIAQAPRVVFGTENYLVEDNQMTVDFSYTLEIKHQKIREQLSMLQGFLPAFITNDSELTTGLALGLDIDKLTPVLTELWTMFTTATYECEPIVELQNQLSSTSPAIMAMFTGMAQGFKGVSIGIYNLEADETSMLGGTIDAIATVSTEKPELLLSLLTSYVPTFQGLEIAMDGTPTSLESLGLPLPASIAVQGKHIVLYTGEKSEKTASTLKNEALNAKGLIAINLDYTRLGDLMMDAAQAYGQFGMGGSSETCTQAYQGALALGQLPMKLTAIEGYSEHGMQAKWSMKMDMLSMMQTYNKIDGEYELSYLDYDCSWTPIGGEDINADGTGRFYELDESMSCEVSESTYTYEKSINFMNQVGVSSKYRDTCDSEWVEDEPFDFDCIILGTTDSGFYCLETYEGEDTLYRYTRK